MKHCFGYVSNYEKTENKMRKGRHVEIITVFSIFILSFVIKSYKIENGDFVVWDEAHFGKFSRKYLSRKFYFDVHPPLGKMLTSLGGYLFNQPLDFKFDSTAKFPKEFDYSGMRRFHSFIASFVPVFSYMTLSEIGYSYRKKILMCILFIFENGFTSIGRLILLDSHLLTFVAAVTYFMTRVHYRSNNSTDIPSLFLLGIFLGCVLSTKWVGLLTTCFVGIFTIYQLWKCITSEECIFIFLKMLFSRTLCLIALPLSMYVFLFYIHFWIVNRSSGDDGHMSSFFQMSLENNNMRNNRKYLMFGTKVTMKSAKSDGGYLHSHNHTYPDDEANQVTTYHHKDKNNVWVFQKVVNGAENVKFVQDGDVVVILHSETRKYLNVPKLNSIVSKRLRVECSGEGLFKSNLFKIEIVNDAIKKEDVVKSLTTRFRLINTRHKCYLRSSSKKYPAWGFKQGEVVCSKGEGDATLWIIEENTSKKAGDDKNPLYFGEVKYSFFKKFIEYNKAMFVTNASFVQDKDLEPETIVSKPYEWFILKRGVRITAWGGSDLKFYMFGNPFTWYSAGICTILAPIILFIKTVKKLRARESISFLKEECFPVFLAVCGWALHYLPFFFVKRVLYFHHYYPALFFSLFSLCYVLGKVQLRYLFSFVCISIVTFFLYSKLIYGFSNTDLRGIRFIPSWDFVEDSKVE